MVAFVPPVRTPSVLVGASLDDSTKIAEELRLWVIVERKKLLSPCHTTRPTFCQPPVIRTVNCVSAVQFVPSAGRSWPRKLIGPTEVLASAASISRLFVGRCSWPPETVGASGPVVGVPPLRV